MTSSTEPTTDGSIPFSAYANIYILRDLSAALCGLVRHEEAAACLAQAGLHAQGMVADSHNARGIALARQGRLDEAIREFTRALEQGGDEVDGLAF